MNSMSSVNSIEDWTQVFPYGITLSSPHTRPVLIFKDKEQREVLPVWLTQVEAGLAILDSQVNLPPASPHRLMHRILRQFKAKLEKCVFTEIIGHHQFADLYFSSESNDLPVMRVRVDEAMSFCLFEKVEFWVKADFMRKSREMDHEIMTSENQKIRPREKIDPRPQFLN